ncbi:Protein ecm33, partial [Smittium mucronatum]
MISFSFLLLGLSFVSAQCNKGLFARSQADMDSVSNCSKLVGDIYVSGSSVTSINLPNLEEIEGSIYLSRNIGLTSVKLDGLKKLSEFLYMLNNSAVVEVSFKSLTTSGDFYISQSPSLSKLDLSSLSQVSDFDLVSSSIGSLNVDNLSTVGNITIISNFNLN